MFLRASLVLLWVSVRLFAYTEANIGTDFKVFHQPGDRFSNQGYASEITSEQLLNSGFTLNEKVGYEHFLSDQGGEHHGLRTELSAMYPASKSIEVVANATYRTLGRKWGDYELGTRINSKQEGFELDLSFERTFIMDSYLSYAGASSPERMSIGEARLHEFQAEMTWNEEVLRYRLKPTLGWITTGSSPSNFKGGARASAELLMIQEDVFDLDLVYEIGFQHYQMDQSGLVYSNVEPYPGGYFSPRLYIDQLPHIAMKYRPSEDAELSLLVGPSLQFVREFQRGAVFAVGAVSHLTADLHMNQWASLKASVAYLSLANHFGRFQSFLSLSYAL